MGTRPRAYLPVGGLSVARQQLGLVLALGCERVVCLARELAPDLIALQHLCEAKGVQFHAISAPRALAGLVTAADELIALADGLLADPEEAIRLLELGQGVLVQPVDTGLAAGFERLDINHASAGAVRMPGRLVERIADLAADIDALSALTRIALQGGAVQRPIAGSEASARRWILVRSEDEAHAIEPAWFSERMSASAGTSPGEWIARLSARKFGPAMLHSASGKAAALAGSALLAVLGLVTGWFGFVATGMILCAIGWIAGQTATELATVERRALMLGPPRFAAGSAFPWAIDLALVLLSGWGIGTHPGEIWGQQCFVPAMAVALAHLVPRLTQSRWAGWLEDRTLLAVVFAAAQASGYPEPALQGLAAILAIGGLALPRGNRG